LLTAVARIRAQHGALSEEVRRHLVDTLASATVARWRSMAATLKDNSGGSESRGNFVAQLVATEHNKSAPEEAKLRTPMSTVQLATAAV
jgi:hypothetical protein